MPQGRGGEPRWSELRAAAAADVELIRGAGTVTFEQVFAAPEVGDASMSLRRTVVEDAVRVSVRPWSGICWWPGPVLPDVAVTDADTRR